MKSLILLFAAMSLFAVPPTTVVQDTVYNLDGSLFNGSIVIGWPTFQRADGSRVQGGSRSVDVKAGAFRASLPVFNGYTVLYLDGTAAERRETWSVTASETALRIQDVRTSKQEDANATSIQGTAVDAKPPDVSQALVYDPVARRWTPKAVFTRPDQYAMAFDAQSYAEGTVSVDSESMVVLGDGTAWDPSMVGWYLVTAEGIGQIASVESPSRMTLAKAWPGGSDSGADYYLSQMVTISGANHQLGTNAFSIRAFQCDGTNGGRSWAEVTPDQTWVIDGSYDVGLLFSQPVFGLVTLQR